MKPVRSRRTSWVNTTVLSWRDLAQRFSFVFFLLFSLGLLVIGHNKPVVVSLLRARVVDSFAPILGAASRPMALWESMSARVISYRDLLKENARLKGEAAALAHWEHAALALQNENKELRDLLRYKPEPAFTFITARVIAEAGGAYVRSLIVTAGRLDGVREGMAAMAGEGLVGRVVEVGDWSSRVLLVTDMNSRIPVTVMGTGDHAILAGDNGQEPELLYLPQDADLKPGMRIMTSGHGGVFPPNLPVGIISSLEHGQARVTPIAALGRINQIRLVDFQLAGGAFNALSPNAQDQAEPPPKKGAVKAAPR